LKLYQNDCLSSGDEKRLKVFSIPEKITRELANNMDVIANLVIMEQQKLLSENLQFVLYF
jgi:hypothetical protein